jgi:hypothetical protein
MLQLERRVRERTRSQALRADQDPGFADERLRLLHRHAHQRCARTRRSRTAAVRVERLARGAFLYEKERAALQWTEAITDIQNGHAADDVFEEVRTHFADAELTSMTRQSPPSRCGIALPSHSSWSRGRINRRPALVLNLRRSLSGRGLQLGERSEIVHQVPGVLWLDALSFALHLSFAVLDDVKELSICLSF